MIFSQVVLFTDIDDNHGVGPKIELDFMPYPGMVINNLIVDSVEVKTEGCLINFEILYKSIPMKNMKFRPKGWTYALPINEACELCGVPGCRSGCNCD